MQRFDSVREKDFNLNFYTRNRKYIQFIESDCRNKGESFSFAHSHSDSSLDLSCKRTQLGNLVRLKLKFILSILIYVEGLRVCNCSMFCCTLLYVHSSFAIILMGKRKLFAVLSLYSMCLLMVVWLFLAVPWVCLQFVIVVFPDHTHLLFCR